MSDALPLGHDRLVWMDLEMSGLDPRRDRVLEVACLVTDGDLRILAEGPEFVVHQSDEVLAGMDDWNQEHHGASGLTERVRRSNHREHDVEDALLEFLSEWCAPRVAPLAGNSIHQDRAFLREHLPRLEAHLHYRNVDVSTVKELVRRWQPEIFAEVPPKTGQHRALADIKESIAELAFYRERAFKTR